MPSSGDTARPATEQAVLESARAALSHSRGRRAIVLQIIWDDGTISLETISQPAREQRRPRGSRCPDDLLDILVDAGPLTLPQLMREIDRRGMEWSERSVQRYLAQLQEEGRVEHTEAGYGVPEGATE